MNRQKIYAQGVVDGVVPARLTDSQEKVVL